LEDLNKEVISSGLDFRKLTEESIQKKAPNSTKILEIIIGFQA